MGGPWLATSYVTNPFWWGHSIFCRFAGGVWQIHILPTEILDSGLIIFDPEYRILQVEFPGNSRMRYMLHIYVHICPKASFTIWIENWVGMRKTQTYVHKNLWACLATLICGLPDLLGIRITYLYFRDKNGFLMSRLGCRGSLTNVPRSHRYWWLSTPDKNRKHSSLEP